MLNKKQQQEMHTHYSIDMKAALNRTFRWVVKKNPRKPSHIQFPAINTRF